MSYCQVRILDEQGGASERQKHQAFKPCQTLEETFNLAKVRMMGILNVNSKEKESEKEGREARKEERKGERREGQGIRWVPSILYLNALHFNPLPTQAMAGTYSISLSPWADLTLVLCSATGNSLPASLHPLNCARHGFDHSPVTESKPWCWPSPAGQRHLHGWVKHPASPP